MALAPQPPLQIHPCSKEGTIAAIEVKVDNIDAGVNETKETLREFVEVLKQIAAQSEQIVGLKETDIRHELNFNNLFPRVGALEVKSEAQSVRIGFIIAGCSVVSSGITGLIIKLMR